MKRIYYLSSCSTCRTILGLLQPEKDVELLDIKEKNIDAATLDWLKEKIGSYEALFSKRAVKFRSMGLNEQDLTETNFRNYLLQEYTFLKRPFIIYEDRVWIGNAKKEVQNAVQFFQHLKK